MCTEWYDERITKKNNEKIDDHRNPYEHDLCRVIHSFAFRRLQGKLQIVNSGQSDFHRNRLTHSLEVGSIAKHIFNSINYRHTEDPESSEIRQFLAKQKELDIDSILQVIGLAHDIGHPPFGHGGEIALNYMLIKNGQLGFEGNAQTFRLLTNNMYEKFNLTKRVLIGLIKYPVTYSNACKKIQPEINELKNRAIKHEEWKPPKCYYDDDHKLINDELLSCLKKQEKKKFYSLDKNRTDHKHAKTEMKSFDCSIMNLADDISYSIHDLEDAIFLKKITCEQVSDLNEILNYAFDDDLASLLLDDLLSNDNVKRKKAIGDLVHHAIINIEIKIIPGFDEPLFKYNAVLKSNCNKLIEGLKKLVRKHLIFGSDVQSIVHGGMIKNMQVFEALQSNPTILLPDFWRKRHAEANKNERDRILCDYISGMTDVYLTKLHERIYGSSIQNMFDWF